MFLKPLSIKNYVDSFCDILEEHCIWELLYYFEQYRDFVKNLIKLLLNLVKRNNGNTIQIKLNNLMIERKKIFVWHM